MNTIGTIFRFTDFGESHGVAVGGVIDGCPAGLQIDFDAIRTDLDRRAGRVESLADTTHIGISARARREQDEIEWLSGLLDGVTLGTPIAFIIRNTDAREQDYESLQDGFRPAHADWTYQHKYGIRDYRGGGRASARETAARVVAGCIAKQLLKKKNIMVTAQIEQVGDKTTQADIRALLEQMRNSNDSIGGIISCTIKNLPAGIGEPIFDKLPSRLAAAVMSINACKGFDYGSGFEGVSQCGSKLNQYSGGALGGISDGTQLRFRTVFKPTPSIGIGGRHDVCIALRAPVIVEAMTAITLIDLIYSDVNRFLNER